MKRNNNKTDIEGQVRLPDCSRTLDNHEAAQDQGPRSWKAGNWVNEGEDSK